jgi:hypothetical protein
MVLECFSYWFTLYLDGRKETVYLKLLQSNKISNMCTVDTGVPQGSVLGPLLFSLYIDFLMLINKILDVIMFVANTSVLISTNFQDEILQKFTNTLNHMSKWFQANWLILNPTKTQVLKFTSGKLPNLCGLRHRSAATRLLGLWVRIPPEAWMSFSCECCVLSGRGLCDRLITHPEESFRLWWVVECDLETSRMRRPWLTGGGGGPFGGGGKKTTPLKAFI